MFSGSPTPAPLEHYNKTPHIAMHALQRFKNALRNINVDTHIYVAKSIRAGPYELQRIICVGIYALEPVNIVGCS